MKLNQRSTFPYFIDVRDVCGWEHHLHPGSKGISLPNTCITNTVTTLECCQFITTNVLRFTAKYVCIKLYVSPYKLHYIEK